MYHLKPSKTTWYDILWFDAYLRISFDYHQAAGTGIPCLSSELLEKNNAEGGDPEEEQTIKRVAAGTFVGEL
jgi:hypothetical protein